MNRGKEVMLVLKAVSQGLLGLYEAAGEMDRIYIQQGGDEFKLVHIDDEKPKPLHNDISDIVLVFSKNRKFIGEDTYSHKHERWRICRDSAKYWLKSVNQ